MIARDGAELNLSRPATALVIGDCAGGTSRCWLRGPGPQKALHVRSMPVVMACLTGDPFNPSLAEWLRTKAQGHVHRQCRKGLRHPPPPPHGCSDVSGP